MRYKLKTLNEFTSAIAALEGKKSPTSIGNIREITSIIIKMVKTDKLARKWFFAQTRVDGKIEEVAEVKERPVKIAKKKAVKK